MFFVSLPRYNVVTECKYKLSFDNKQKSKRNFYDFFNKVSIMELKSDEYGDREKD